MSEKTLKRYRRALWNEEIAIINNFIKEVQRMRFTRRLGIAWDILFPSRHKKQTKRQSTFHAMKGELMKSTMLFDCKGGAIRMFSEPEPDMCEGSNRLLYGIAVYRGRFHYLTTNNIQDGAAWIANERIKDNNRHRKQNNSIQLWNAELDNDCFAIYNPYGL